MYKIHIFVNMDFFTEKKLLSECVMNFSKEFLKKQNSANIRSISIDDLRATTAFMDTDVYFNIKGDLYILHDRFTSSNEDFAFQIQNLLIIYFNTAELIDIVRDAYKETYTAFSPIQFESLPNNLLVRILIAPNTIGVTTPIDMDFREKVGVLDGKFEPNPVLDNRNIINSAIQNFMEKYYYKYSNILRTNYNFQFIQKYTPFLAENDNVVYNVVTLTEVLQYCYEIKIMLEISNGCSLMYITNGELNGQ